MSEKGKCIIFSAPSGAGKTTIVRYLLSRIEGLEFSVSATSRQQRPGEIYGRDYYFLSVEEFKNRIANNKFLEWEEVYKDNFYGTLKSEINRIWAAGKHVIFDVDVIGGLNLKHQLGDMALAIFVMPPSIEHLEQRLRNRETETEQSIQRRIGKAGVELKTASRFDRIILNDNLSTACSEAEKITREFLAE